MGRFKFTFSVFLLLLLTTLSFSQEKEKQDEDELYAPVEEKEPLVVNSLKVGVNVARFADFFFKPERRSTELSIDLNLSNKYFPVIEGGISEISIIKDNYWYKSEGSYIKAGVDFNMLKKYPTDYFGIGLRLGRAQFEQSATGITFENSHWPLQGLSIDSKSYATYWLEVSFGLKGELIKNVYFGWSALVRLAVAGRKDEQFQPYDIPGFGKGSSAINLGANYYIYYQIPFKKKY